MPESSQGAGAAYDAGAAVEDGDPVDVDRVTQGETDGRDAALAAAQDAVAAAQAKVDRQNEHLAGAQDALTEAEAALEAHSS